jgi:hypothetical protein
MENPFHVTDASVATLRAGVNPKKDHFGFASGPHCIHELSTTLGNSYWAPSPQPTIALLAQLAQLGSLVQQVLQDRHGNAVPIEAEHSELGAVAQGRQEGSELEILIPQSSMSRVFSLSVTICSKAWSCSGCISVSPTPLGLRCVSWWMLR